MLALTDVSATIGLLVIFVGLFPVIVQGLLAFIAAQVAGEHRRNEEYRNGRR